MCGVRTTEEESELANEATCGLGTLRIKHPTGTFPVTPASLVSLRAIGKHQQLLSGIGIDWGPGSGVLSIAAARIKAVTKVFGLEIVADNVESARENARLNTVAEKTVFLHADSFAPFVESDADTVTALKGKVQFVLANPPSSEGDDGFDFRRRVLREAREFLHDGAVVFLSISSQYGQRRIANLTADSLGYTHSRLLATTDWVPFDLERPDLFRCLKAYVQEERRGGLEYEFALPKKQFNELVNAQVALSYYERTGKSPLSKWQTHLFKYRFTENPEKE